MKAKMFEGRDTHVFNGEGDNMQLIKHKSGCGGPAFYSLKMGGAYNGYPSSHVDDILTLNGEKPEIGKPLMCGTCGEVWEMVESMIIVVREN